MSEDKDTPIEPFCLISEPVRGGRPRPEPATFLQPIASDGQTPPAVRKKLCCTCRRLLPVDQFCSNRSQPDGLEKRCRECRRVAQQRLAKPLTPEQITARNAYRRQYLRDHPDKAKLYSRNQMAKRTYEYAKHYQLKCHYGISHERFEEMVAEQEGVCAICGKPETRKNKHRGVAKLHIDHNHVTGKVRGLLCCKCNFAIGGVNEDTEILRKMIEYLERHKSE